MRRRRVIFATAVVVLLLAGAVGAYAYDHSRSETIAKGVRVGGIAVGGLRSAAARAKLEAEFVEPLRKPVVATYGGRRFALSPRTAHVEVDVDELVDRALARSRDGSIVTRVARDVTGASVDADVDPHVRYSRQAVDRFVADVGGQLDRDPKDATIAFAGDSLDTVDGQDGVEVERHALRRAVARALRAPRDQARTVKIRAKVVRPAVTTEQLAAKYATVITVDRPNFKLYLWKQLRLAKAYTIAIGQVGLDTPAGLYHIQNKAVDPVWTVPNSAWAGDLAGQQIPPGPENPLKARWLGIFDGAGIHGTDAIYSLGTAASHGCVRMAIPDVIELYDQTPVGAPIYVA